jgi:hypothetical protein
MIGAEHFHLFPHGIVYTALAVVICWLAFMTGLACRALCRTARHRAAGPGLVRPAGVKGPARA